jgi:hypothetical protein
MVKCEATGCVGKLKAGEPSGVACRRQRPSEKCKFSFSKTKFKINRTWIKLTTHTGKKTANEEESETRAMGLPRHWNCNSGRDKSYKMTNKTSKEVMRRARETSSQTATKAKKNSKGKRRRRREGKRWGLSKGRKE